MSGDECRLPLVKVQLTPLPSSTMVNFSSFVALVKNEFYTANNSNQTLPVFVMVAQTMSL
jgi:proteasome assembly chaperone (PAC2) family protein